jgi:Calcineurin-like phosphoesterase
MIADILDRNFVLARLEEVRAQLKEMAEAFGGRRSEEDSVFDEFRDLAAEDLDAAHVATDEALARELAASSGQQGFDREDVSGGRRGGPDESSLLDSKVFLSRDPDVCTLQSALDEFFVTHAQDRVVTATPADPLSEMFRRGGIDESDEDVSSDLMLVTDRRLAENSSDRRIFDQFSVTDIRWISCLYAEAKRNFSKRHPFSCTPASSTLAARTRLVMVGDWASGLPRAINVAKRMRDVLDEGIRSGIEQHAIHLGDTYYSGWPTEYERRFLPYWPVTPSEARKLPSWTLNANHDMYSGGYGYYDTLLRDPRFAKHEGCSYFTLQSPYWRILGLDTGWKEGDLEGPQADWARAQCDEAASNGQKVLLLSHHQLFSSYERSDTELQKRLGRLLGSGRVHTWIWGHEHRCMVYGPYEGLRYAACVGHGGVPVYMNHDADAPYPPPGIYEDRRFMKHGFERWAYMGFCVLEFEDRQLAIRYLDENGVITRTDRIPE